MKATISKKDTMFRLNGIRLTLLRSELCLSGLMKTEMNLKS